MSADEVGSVEGSALEELKSLREIADVAMLVSMGIEAGEIASYIKYESGQMAGRSLKAVEKAVIAYARLVISGEAKIPSPAVMSPKVMGRSTTMANVTKLGYIRGKSSIDALIELEGLYLGAKWRIDRIIEREDSDPEFTYKLAPEIQAAKEILKLYQDIKSKTDDDVNEFTVSVRGSEAVKALTSPEARHKVISLVDKFRMLTAESKPVSEVVESDGVELE